MTAIGQSNNANYRFGGAVLQLSHRRRAVHFVALTPALRDPRRQRALLLLLDLRERRPLGAATVLEVIVLGEQRSITA